MCGITRLIDWDVCKARELHARPELLDCMCRIITYRGSDGQGVLVKDGVALQMRRLSIIDPAGGHHAVEALDAYLLLGYVPYPLSIFLDIHKLRLGRHLSFFNCEALVSEYRDFRFIPPTEVRSEDDYREHLRELATHPRAVSISAGASTVPTQTRDI